MSKKGYLNDELIDQLKNKVVEYLDQNLSPDLIFHRPEHTLDVLRNVNIIGDYCQLNENDLNIARLSAIFHDIGYVKTYTGHELQSVILAKEFLASYNLDDQIILKIENSILATCMPQNPLNLISRVLCDADLMHLTYGNYFEFMEPLRQEWKKYKIADFNEIDFHKNSVIFFKKHFYFTKYGKQILTPLKNRNLKKIIVKIQKLNVNY